MNLVIMLVAGINIGVVLGAWWATGRIREPHESWPELQLRNMSELRLWVRSQLTGWNGLPVKHGRKT
jgi:hypothetical protein